MSERARARPDSGHSGPFVAAAKLRLECWDKDKITADDFMGACEVDIASLASGGTLRAWIPLAAKASKGDTSAGEVRISLTLPCSHTLTLSHSHTLTLSHS